MTGTGELVLYLDLDGVLHHENVYWHPRRGAFLKAPDRYTLFQHVPLLDEVLTPYPDLQIVLSTSWVRVRKYSRTLKRLSPALRNRVIGATFHSAMDVQAFQDLPRGEQVLRDVVRRQPRAWMALDDVDDGWSSSTPNAVRPVAVGHPVRPGRRCK